ncbi:MAG: autotransporter assembly complex family protein, partial [Legionellales bacterium]
MLNSRFSTSVCVLLGMSLTAPSILAETADASAANSSSASTATVAKQDNAAVSSVVNPVAKDSATASSSKAAIEDTQNSPSPITLPSAEAKPSLLTRIANRVFFWRKPTNKYSVPVEPTINVDVSGAPEILETNLKETLKQVTVVEFDDFQSDLPRLRGLAVDAAQAVGYYTATFHFSKISNDRLKVDVVPDTPVIVASQKITITGDGATDKAFIQLQKKPDLKVGDTLNHGEYEKTKNKILNIGTEHGYFKGHYLTHDVQVTLPPKTADILLSYDTGVRYVFGDITYKNSNPKKKLPLKPSVLAALQPFKAGDPYDAASLAKLSRNLQDTRYFNNVQVDAPTPDIVPDNVANPADSSTQTQQTDAATDVAKPVAVKTDDTSQTKSTAIATDSTVKPIENSAKPSIPVDVVLNADNPNSVEAGVGYGT